MVESAVVGPGVVAGVGSDEGDSVDAVGCGLGGCVGGMPGGRDGT